MKKNNKLLKGFYFKFFCFLFRVKIITDDDFPSGFKKTLHKDKYGIFSEEAYTWIIDMQYLELVYNKTSKLFLGRKDNNAYLFNHDGKQIYATRHSDLSFMGEGVGIFQDLIPNGDGTFKCISKNTLAGNGREVTINAQGQTIGEYKSFTLEP